MSVTRLAFVLSTLFAAAALPAAASAAESTLSARALAALDNQRYQLRQYQADWTVEGASAGAQLVGRFFQYELEKPFAGVSSFRGSEPAIELGAHLLAERNWFGGAVGFQGTPDLQHATGSLTLARAFPTDVLTVTPRVTGARAPLALFPLPLSLGVFTRRAEAALGLRASLWMAEAGARFDFWESATVQGRVQNPGLAAIGANRVTTAYAYALSQSGTWFDAGLSSKAAWATRNTLLATQTAPVWAYSWYPASAPPFLWETAVVLRAQGHLHPSLEVTLQLQLPAISQERRQFESLRVSYWGTAPFEGKLQTTWAILSTTSLQVTAEVFAKPWERWDVTGPGAYRQASVQVALQQKI